MDQVVLKISSNEQVVPDIFKMVLQGDVNALQRPGQFVNIALPGLYLRRPISVSEYNRDSLTLLYKVVGAGTKQMRQLQPGTELNILNALGNGFRLGVLYQNILLAGGGIGIAPLFQLAKNLLAEGKKVSVALCFNTESEVFYVKEFQQLGAQVYVATVDGSMGIRGFITDLIKEQQLDFEYFYACGPMPMLKALCMQVRQPGQVSLEARMGCGFGICMGCSIQTKQGTKRVCKEGPVFDKEEVIW